MAFPPTIAVIAPGTMGAAVASRFTKAGCTVLTTLEGRSASTIERAKKAGMEDASLVDIARRADFVLSIIPPSSAVVFAEAFKKAYDASSGNPKLAFADCNAVSPETVKRIARVFDGSTVRFVDASIIGGPPTDGYDPAFYASAAPEDERTLDSFVGLSAWGLRTVALKGEGAGVGDASALKMSYAGITKGFIGLTTTMILAANASSPATAQALMHELHASQPFYLERITRSVPGMLPKAYRWVGEMEEISAFVRDGLGDGEAHVHRGFAHLYDRVEKALPDGEDVAVLKKFVEEAKATIRGSGVP
ncbi:6-phosphogluconate dehydrogenase C-terminal domain-like protein [Dichomitus squalens LYAD-421 SS1]|uniref:6-phosphogluconate dehydrogenase C-terminal domain-like protein n=1 Tax=Dichomitus squalens (strain LYAD-421) TaxID=732165 RepID=R7SPB2_DICSQ|nr:6-phosphogluconate dehydrogenase C-terminal domain-like protein [Dichomitus squalens LYAD-421 SS1]EJF57748.1 6-phosphogluconate dehydrogenase C-terminal domain-like protein [Dichomitus squalens LYAD-421 SS1]